MSKLFLHFSLLISTFTLVADYCPAQGSKNQKTDLLVSPSWLEAEMKSNSNLRIIDLAFRKTNFKTGHIPGAVFLDWRTDIIDSENTDMYRLPEKQAFEKLLSRIGVSADTTVVLTDNMFNRASVRMYYTLKYFGHKDVRILNGGTKNWDATGKKLTTDITKVERSNYKVREANEDYVIKLEAVKKAIGSDQQIIDGRPIDQFTGKLPGKVFHTNKAHKRLGHLPDSINVPWMENLNKDGTFKSLKNLRELYASHGIDVDGDGEVVTYCNEGLHAAMPWFILRELFGNEEIRLYDDSMAEWANREDTPLEKSESAQAEGK